MAGPELKLAPKGNQKKLHRQRLACIKSHDAVPRKILRRQVQTSSWKRRTHRSTSFAYLKNKLSLLGKLHVQLTSKIWKMGAEIRLIEVLRPSVEEIIHEQLWFFIITRKNAKYREYIELF